MIHVHPLLRAFLIATYPERQSKPESNLAALKLVRGVKENMPDYHLGQKAQNLTCLQGVGQSESHTSLLGYKDWIEYQILKVASACSHNTF